MALIMITPQNRPFKLEDHVKNLGYTVEYRHCRFVIHTRVNKNLLYFTPMPVSVGEVRKNPEKFGKAEIWNFGGSTHAIILDKNGNKIATGLAHCSINENFCKATGRQIALRRAYELLKETEKAVGDD